MNRRASHVHCIDSYSRLACPRLAACTSRAAEWRDGDEAARDLAFTDTMDAGDGETYSVRMMYVHVIGEYARHNGHADMLRQAIDGVTGR